MSEFGVLWKHENTSVRWITETPEHDSVATFQEKATQISHGRNPSWTVQFFFNVILQFLPRVVELCLKREGFGLYWPMDFLQRVVAWATLQDYAPLFGAPGHRTQG